MDRIRPRGHRCGAAAVRKRGRRAGGHPPRATLAAVAASERTDVAALVVWGPFTTGRAYVRQLRAYRMLNALPDDPRGSAVDGDEEAAGYRLTRSTVAELERFDLRALARAPAPRVLVLSRETGSDEALVGAWKERGSEVTVGAGTGWPEMMQQPRKSVVPEAVLEETCRFLAGVPAGVAGREREAPHGAPRDWSWSAGDGVVEEAVCLGEGGAMAGVLGRPEHGSTDALPTVLFLTTASHHRIGPNRLWVRLGRALSALGLQTLRFDLTGVGDSLLLPGESPTHAYSRESVSRGARGDGRARAADRRAPLHPGGAVLRRVPDVPLGGGRSRGWWASWR